MYARLHAPKTFKITILLDAQASEIVFNVGPSTKVIWRRDHSLVLSDGLKEPGIKLWTLVYKASGAGSLFDKHQNLMIGH